MCPLGVSDGNMKLYPFVVLLAVLGLARAAEQCIPPVHPGNSLQTDCNNRISDDECKFYVEIPGCRDLSIRLNCKKECNICDSYEQARPNGDRAVLYGGNHILTWDQLRFDCAGIGEFILYNNSRTGMKVHALFTRPKNVVNSVSTAVAANGSYDKKDVWLQIALERAATENIIGYDVGNCEKHLRFWVGPNRKWLSKSLTPEQVARLGGYSGISMTYRSARVIQYRMDLRSGARVTVSLRYSKNQGCYFSQVQVLITTDQKPNTTGLLGTPDNYIYNDWQFRNGTTWDIPQNRMSRYLFPSYDYCTTVWCVQKEAGSIINYKDLGSFSENSKCTAGYEGFKDFSSAEPAMEKVCGKKNFECLHDSVSTNSVSEGIQTIDMMKEIEENTVPNLKDGLSAHPRGIPAGEIWTVTIFLKSNHSETELNGFGLFEINEDSLRMNGDSLDRTEAVVAFLSDDGVSGKGDEQQFDQVYTDQIALELPNGDSKGYAAVPLINGIYEFGRKDLIYTLPNAVRGYSVESGRTEAVNGNSARNKIFTGILLDEKIEVKFEGPEDREPIIGGARFLEEYVGDMECGDLYRVSDHLNCIQCMEGGRGDATKLLFRIGRAIGHNRISQTASVLLEGFFLGSFWSSDAEERVPVKITATVTRNDQDLSSISMYVNAKQRVLSDDDENLWYCTRQFPDSLLGELKISAVEGRKWRISLESRVI